MIEMPLRGHVFDCIGRYSKTVNRREMSMTIFSTISFFDVSMALLFIGIAERVLLTYAPAEMVGPDGWLLRPDPAE